MKKIGFLLLCSFFLLSSCLSMINSVVEDDKPKLHWTIGSFVDDWGDKTGNYFAQYAGEVRALFSNSAGYKNEPTTLRELTFSRHEGLAFYIAGWIAPMGSKDVLFNIKFADGSTKELNGHQQWTEDSRVIVFIPYSEELPNILLQENIVIRFSILPNNVFFQFDFPKQFKEAYEQLQAKQKG